MRVLILGPQGSGKGTQARRIAEQHGVPHVSTGDILRAAVSDETELGLRVKPILERGDLVPDELMIDLIRERLAGEEGFVLDGFPRTLAQAESLDAMLAGIAMPLDTVILLEVSDEEAMSRMLGRAAEEGRSDDTPGVITKRLSLYHELTRPVVERYRAAGELVVVDGECTMDEVFAAIESALGGLEKTS